jgi:ERCC4-type nuclease
MSDLDLVLHIDYREQKIADSLVNDICETKVVNLDVGDFIFRINDTSKLIIERKTTSDLMSSIIDGRFRDQKNRLGMTGLPVCFIIEKDTNLRNDTAKKKIMYRGSIINLIFKHKFNVIYSDSIEETSQILKTMFNKIKKGDILLDGSETCIKENFVSKSKAVSDNIFVSQLCLIRGVSPAIAEKIVEQYKTPRELIKACDMYDGPSENFLSDIILKNGKRLGKALSKRIMSTF